MGGLPEEAVDRIPSASGASRRACQVRSWRVLRNAASDSDSVWLRSSSIRLRSHRPGSVLLPIGP